MEFNIQKYLSENKLTKLSFLREEDKFLDLSADTEEPTDDIEDDEDDWNKPEADDTEDFEAEPAKPEEQPAQQNAVSSEEKQEYDRLKMYVKDLVAKYTQKKITLDAYKEKIYNDPKYGDIIQTLKKLDQKFYPAVTAGDDEEDKAL